MEHALEAVVESTTRRRKRSASSSSDRPASKRFQDDVDDVLGDIVPACSVPGQPTSDHGASVEDVKSVPDEGNLADRLGEAEAPDVTPLVRQNTFTKEDSDSSRAGQFYIPVDNGGNADRREALRRRFAQRSLERSLERAARRSSGDGDKANTAGRRRTQNAAAKTTTAPTARSGRGGGKPGGRREAPVDQPPPLQRQGTFTVDTIGDPMDPGDAEDNRTVDDRGRGHPVASDDHHLAVGGGADDPCRASLVSVDGDVDEVVAGNSNESPASVAEMRATLAALRKGRAAAERSERVARERASRDAERTRAALRDLHERLAATRASLHAEKEGLHRKLSADFRRALQDREALWRQERERAQVQVRTLETEVRSLRAQLSAVQADALRKASVAEAELKRAFHDQEGALRSQLADMAKQRDSLQAQLRDRTVHERPPSPAVRVTDVRDVRRHRDEEWQRILRREQQDSRRKQALLEAQLKEAQQAASRSSRSTPTHWESELARGLHQKEQQHRRDMAEAVKKQDALRAQLRDALRALRTRTCMKAKENTEHIRSGKQMTLALESHPDEGEGPELGKEEGGEEDLTALGCQSEPPGWAAPIRQHPRPTQKRCSKRRREEEEDDDEEEVREDEQDDESDDERRRLLRQAEGLHEANAALKLHRVRRVFKCKIVSESCARQQQDDDKNLKQQQQDDNLKQQQQDDNLKQQQQDDNLKQQQQDDNLKQQQQDDNLKQQQQDDDNLRKPRQDDDDDNLKQQQQQQDDDDNLKEQQQDDDINLKQQQQENSDNLKQQQQQQSEEQHEKDDTSSTAAPDPDPSNSSNAGEQGEQKPMRHFHRLISLEPVSEVDEYSAGGEGGGLGPRPLMSESPLSSGPSSLSPTPGIGDVWNDLAAGCASGCATSSPAESSSGSSSPGGESLGGSPGASPSPDQLGPHAVLYWQLMRDHLQLQRAYQQLQQAGSRSDRQARAKLEAQVYDLKRALSRRSTHSSGAGAALADALQDVVELRQREESLTTELAELRDQNELLEFRMLELEGVVDKSSVCSATRDVCTDTESDTVTEDSGLLSLGASDDGDPHGHHDSVVVRERLSLLANSLQGEEDRGCLQRALQLLDSYQHQLSKQQDAGSRAVACKAPNQRIVATVLPFSEAAEATDDSEDSEDAKPPPSRREEFRRKQEFFNQMQRLGHHQHQPTNHNNNNNNNTIDSKKTLRQSDCLQESGIFEADSEDGGVGDLASTATQTDSSSWTCSCHQSTASLKAAKAIDNEVPFSSLPPPSGVTGVLSAEIEKLSQIRERFEEQGSVSKLKLPDPPTVAPSAASSPTQMQHKLRELEFFRSRAASLEDKLAELERCSDPELRGCARLLERVAALERQAREAREAADLLVRRNRDLEEDRCELEEAENDTRLRCQQLEVEVVQLREREGALEVELGRARRSLSAAHQLQGRLEMALQSLETRNFELEEAECELRASIAAVESALPAIVAFHLAHYKSYLQKRELGAMMPLPVAVRSTAVSTEDHDDDVEESLEYAVDDASMDVVDGSPRKRDDSEVLERLAQLVAAEKDMHQKIAFLEQKESAFQETLAAADGLWSEMELNYKRRLAKAEEAEEELRRKVRRLEDSEAKLRKALTEQAALSERVHDLEAQERALLSRIRGLEQEKQAVAEEVDRFHEDMKATRAALAALQARVDGPMAEDLSAERRRAEDLVEELRGRQEALAALEQRTNTEISALQTQIAVGEKTMQDMEVTCAELREEVDTLEEAVTTLRGQLSAAHDKAERDLIQMESALAERDRLVERMRLTADKSPPAAALDHEMAAAAAAASRQPEEDDEAAPPTTVTSAPPPPVSLFRKSLQAFRNSEMMMMMMANKPATPPKPVPKRETVVSDKPFMSLPPMSLPVGGTATTPTPLGPAAKRTPPPLPPKNVVSLKWPRSDSSAASGR